MLLDTSGLLSYFDASDPHHADAVRIFTAAPRRVTHSYVLAEVVALCHARRLPRIGSLRLVADVMENPHVEMHWIDEPAWRAAFALLEARPDQTYSLCVAISFL